MALLLPLSGSWAPIGTALFNAAQLALFEIADDTLTLVPFDTKGTPEGAQAAAQAALSQHADIIIGPLLSGEVKAVGAVARPAHVPVLAFTTDRTTAGEGVYVLGFLPGPQGQQVALYARAQNRSRLAVLAPSNEYGRRLVEYLYNDPSIGPSAVVAVQYYNPTATDFSQPIRQLIKPGKNGDVGFDALLIPEEGQRLRSIAAMLSLQGIDPAKIKLLGPMLWEDPRNSSEPALAGGWYAAPSGANHADFENRYAKAFTARPPRLASLAYDATALAAVLAKRHPHDYSGPMLTNPTGFAGVDGLFRLLPDGTSDRGYAIWEVVPGGPAKEVAPAPTAFGG